MLRIAEFPIDTCFFLFLVWSTNRLFVFSQAERLRKQADQERQEAADNLATVTSQNNALSQAKKKLEGTIGTLQEEAEDLENEAKNADDRAKKAAIEVTLYRILP